MSGEGWLVSKKVHPSITSEEQCWQGMQVYVPCVQVQEAIFPAHTVGICCIQSRGQISFGKVKQNRNQRTKSKSRVLDNRLINCVPPQEYSHLCWLHANLQKVCLVFDGGMEGSPPLEEPPPEAPPKASSNHMRTKETTQTNKTTPMEVSTYFRRPLVDCRYQKSRKGYHIQTLIWRFSIHSYPKERCSEDDRTAIS